MRSNSGQSIIEMLVALSIVVVALLGILVLVNRSVGLSRVTNDQYTASYLAFEGIEIVKNMFDQTYLAEAQSNSFSENFYGWAGTNCIISGCSLPASGYQAYIVDYKSQGLQPVSCSFSSGTSAPTEDDVRDMIFSCGSYEPDFGYLRLDKSDFPIGAYSYNASYPPTKFKRVIIIDRPVEFSAVGTNLDYRVTSAVGWETRGGGRFVVQLQDHFLPWRIP